VREQQHHDLVGEFTEIYLELKDARRNYENAGGIAEKYALRE
jgi:hypothetical protein